MDTSEVLDPIINADEFDELVELLFCHGLHKDFPDLLSRINEICPNLAPEPSSPHRQILFLLAYCQSFQKNGPLPDIRHTMFLSTLHDSVVGLFKTEQKLVELMTKESTYKLVGGLRAVLARSILMSPKYTVKDIERTISSYFPTLPVKPSNYRHWESWAEILKVDLEEKSDALTFASNVNRTSAKYLKDKLDSLPVERKKCHDESIITVWTSIAPKFDEFVRHLRSLLPENFLVKIGESSHPKIRMLSGRISPGADEDEVMAFFDYLSDISIESKFWNSDFVQTKIAECVE